MRFRISALLLALLPATAFAADPPPPWSGEVSAGLIATSGNSETTTANGKVQLVYTSEAWRNTFEATLIKTEQTATDTTTGIETETVTAERYLIGDKADLNLTEHDYLFVALEFEKDLVGPVRQRTSETAGYGRKVLTGPEQLLELELGAGMRQTESQIVLPTAPVAEKDDDVIVRGRLAYKWQFGEASHFGETVKVESGDSNTFNESVTELRLSLVDTLYVLATYTVRNNSDVPAGTEKTDTITAFNLGWSFGKK